MSNRSDTNAELEAELLALLHGNLDADRTMAVTEYLSDQPERVADLLADANTAAALRMALSVSHEPPPPGLVAEATRLQDRLRWQKMFRRIRPYAAAVVLFAAGWGGHMAWQARGPDPTPPLVEAALDAQAALELRHWMKSQPESVDLNPEEIIAALGVELPSVPEDWTLRDVQVVATPDRPGIAIAMDTPLHGRLLLLVVARSEDDVEDPLTTFEYRGQTIALFDRGDAAFVLVDESGHPEQLAAGATRLLSMLN